MKTPMICHRKRCWRPTADLSVWCRRHTGEYLDNVKSAEPTIGVTSTQKDINNVATAMSMIAPAVYRMARVQNPKTPIDAPIVTAYVELGDAYNKLVNEFGWFPAMVRKPTP